MHSSTGPADSELGPFQEIWNAWNEVDQEIKKKPIEHFRRAIDIQFDELEEHLRNNDRTRARREAMDVISIALNVILIRLWGVTGAAIATSSALVAASAFNWYAARKLEGLNLFVLANLPGRTASK